MDVDAVQLIGLTIALAVVFLTLILYFVYYRSKTSRRVVMMTGLCSSGKTLLFARLIYNKYANTHVSIRENLAEYTTEKGNLTIVDIPGHERLREKYIEQYKKTSRAIVFVIDSVTFQKEIQDVAEYLYIILTDPMVATNCKNILILCNKQDHPTAKGLPVIRSQLEKELNTVKMTKSSQLSSTDDSGITAVSLCPEDRDFEFSICSIYNISFGESCAVNKEAEAPPKIESLEKWLTTVA